MKMGGQTPPAGGSGGAGGGAGTGLAPNIASLLCYICPPITGIIFLIIEKANKDVIFHAWQSTTFGVTAIVLWFAFLVLRLVTSWIPAFDLLLTIVAWFLFIGYVVIYVVCLVKAYQGERWRIPAIGDFAAKKAETL